MSLDSIQKASDFYLQKLKDWDQLIKSGQITYVYRLCKKLNHKKIPRHLLIDFAQIARRIGAPQLIVYWFNPVIRSEKKLDIPATNSEKAIYALGLLRLGAFAEASQILYEDLKNFNDPQVFFYRASLNMNQWNYPRAIVELKKYVKHPETPTYLKLDGLVNLCAAYVSNQNWKSAEAEISKLETLLRTTEHKLLLGNLLEIKSQLLVASDRYAEALQATQESAVLLQKADEKSKIQAKKWNAITELKSKKNLTNEIFQIFDEVKTTALRIKEWEIVRDCDLQLALHLNDPYLLSKIYWGTFFAKYKEKIQEQIKHHSINQKTYILSRINNLSSMDANEKVIDIVKEAPSVLLKKLFFILSRDFYRPMQVTEIFSFIYTNEFYNPVSSKIKINRLIQRARIWLKQALPNTKIISFGNSYKLIFDTSLKFEIHRDFKIEKTVNNVDKLANQKFTAKDWQRIKNVSARTARRQIHQLVQNGEVISFQRGPKTYYLVNNSKITHQNLKAS